MKKKIISGICLVGILISNIVSCKKENGSLVIKSDKDSVSTSLTGALKIGQSYGGGVIFFIDTSLKHGLIMAQLGHQTPLPWCIGASVITYATGVTYGWGRENTTAIVNKQGNQEYAANVCYKLVVNGYDDWFLPSKDELNILYQQKAQGKLQGLTDAFYWSSTETSSTEAWSQSFSNGATATANKNGSYGVCPIRSF